MTEGKVKFFNESKSFGFIEGDDGKDYFVNRDAITKGPITEVDKVIFKTEETPKGLKALEVEKV